MGRFVGTFKLSPITPKPNSYWYEPGSVPLTYYSDNGGMFQLEESFETDLASVPRFLWSIPGFATGDWPRPALLHDWLYQKHHDGKDIVGFNEANELLQEAMRAEGSSMWLAWMYKAACNKFGKCIWDNYCCSIGE